MDIFKTIDIAIYNLKYELFNIWIWDGGVYGDLTWTTA